MSIQDLQQLLRDVKTSAVSIDDRVLGSGKECFFLFFCLRKANVNDIMSEGNTEALSQVHGPLRGPVGLAAWRTLSTGQCQSPPPQSLGAPGHVMLMQRGHGIRGGCWSPTASFSQAPCCPLPQEGSEGLG